VAIMKLDKTIIREYGKTPHNICYIYHRNKNLISIHFTRMYMPSLAVNIRFKSYNLTVSRFIPYGEVTLEIIRSRDNPLLSPYEGIALFFALNITK